MSDTSLEVLETLNDLKNLDVHDLQDRGESFLVEETGAIYSYNPSLQSFDGNESIQANNRFGGFERKNALTSETNTWDKEQDFQGGTAFPNGSITPDDVGFGAHVSTVGPVAPVSIANGSVYTNEKLTTYNGKQYIAYWDHGAGLSGIKSHLVLASRSLPRGEWTQYTYDGSGGRATITSDTEEHNTTAINFDNDGYLHIIYGMRNDPIVYRRSANPEDVSSLTNDFGTLSGGVEHSVEYPMFFKDSAGNLFCIYRNGGSGNGTIWFHEYDLANKTWNQDGILASNDSDGNSVNGYPGVPRFDDEDNLYIPYCWRDTTDSSTNHNIGLLVRRNGNWEALDGTSVTVPIQDGGADDQACRVNTIPNGEGLLNQSTEIDIDSNGNPLITHNKYDSDGHMQLFADYWDGSSWNEIQISDGGSTTGIGDYYSFARPKVAIDRTNDRYYILYRDGADDGHKLAYSSDISGPYKEAMIVNQNVYGSSPLYDRAKWVADQEFSIFHSNPRMGDQYAWGVDKPDNMDGYIIDFDPSSRFTPTNPPTIFTTKRNHQLPLVRATKTSNQAITTDTLTKVTWDTSSFRDDDFSTSNNEFVAPNHGVYQISVMLTWESVTSGTVLTMEWQIDGSEVVHFETGASASVETVNASQLIELEAGETFTVHTQHDTGSDLSIRGEAGSAHSRMTIQQVPIT